MSNKLQFRGTLVVIGIIVAISIYYGSKKSGYFYYDDKGRKIEIKEKK